MFHAIRKNLISMVLGWVVPLTFMAASAAFSAEIPHQISGLDLVTGKSETIALSSAQRATVIVFLSTRCPCSASHQAVLNQIAGEFGAQGIRMVGVHSNANESQEEAMAYFSVAKLAFPVIQDPRTVLADRFEAFKTPHAYIVGPKLEILFQGGVDNSKIYERATQHYLRDALSEIVQGRLPREKTVRVVGCQIQRP